MSDESGDEELPDGDDLAVDVPPPTSEADLSDEEGVSQRVRLKAIHTAHDHAADARMQVKQALVQNAIGEQEAREIYRTAVETFLMEVEPLLLGHLEEPDDGDDDPLTARARDLWQHATLGEMSVDPPPRLVQLAHSDRVRLAARARPPEPKRVQIDGLQHILDLPSPLSLEWTIVARGSNGPHRQHRDTREVELSLDVLDEAFRRTNELLAEIGGWADFDSGRPLNEWEWELEDTADA